MCCAPRVRSEPTVTAEIQFRFACAARRAPSRIAPEPPFIDRLVAAAQLAEAEVAVRDAGNARIRLYGRGCSSLRCSDADV